MRVTIKAAQYSMVKDAMEPTEPTIIEPTCRPTRLADRMEHVVSEWINELGSLTDHERYVRHHQRLAALT